MCASAYTDEPMENTCASGAFHDVVGRDVFGREAKTRDRLIVFTRWPRPGEAKTRLIPALGAEGAAYLQRRMTHHVLRQGRELRRRRGTEMEVRFEGGTPSLMRQRFGGGIHYRRQPAGGLGERMSSCMGRAFEEGCDRVVLVGSDCPRLSADHLAEAFGVVGKRDLVLGPARDGGYYLVGLRRPAPSLFDGPQWGSADVLRKTLARARRLGLSHVCMETLRDVDRPADLTAADGLRVSDEAGKISIVIPALNERDCIEGCVESARRGLRTEVIVADGGSEDGTAEAARRAGAHVLRCECGRSRQMNAGAAHATGSTLLFLHADTRLPDGYEGCVRRLLGDGANVAGAFRMYLGSCSAPIRFIERTVNARARYLQFPYGDQALFLRRETFDGLGGFPDMPIMEDYEFVRRLRARGRIALARASVYTSPRRWQRKGVWKTTLLNKCMIAGYHAGISPAQLACWYRDNSRAMTGPANARQHVERG